jgi:hypothetical protein
MSEYIYRELLDTDGNIVGREYGGKLIRCKDCKYRDEETANCTRFRKDWYVQSNSFCSWAERRGEE